MSSFGRVGEGDPHWFFHQFESFSQASCGGGSDRSPAASWGWSIAFWSSSSINSLSMSLGDAPLRAIVKRIVAIIPRAKLTSAVMEIASMSPGARAATSIQFIGEGLYAQRFQRSNRDILKLKKTRGGAGFVQELWDLGVYVVVGGYFLLR